MEKLKIKYLVSILLVVIVFSGCANYQTLADWKNDRVGYRYATVESCEIKDGAYVGTDKLAFGEDKGKVVKFYLKPLFKPKVPYTSNTVLLVEPK